MAILTAVICSIIFTCLSYFLVKTYQLNSYDIKKYITSVLDFNFSLGDKNKLVFTKRIIRFFIGVFIVSFLIFFVINYFIKSVFAIILTYAVFLLLSPFFVVFTHFLLLPIEILIKK